MSKSSVRIFNSLGRRSRSKRGLAFAAVAGLTVGLSLFASPASAFTTTTFQLDGNAKTNVPSATATNDDWDKVCYEVTYKASYNAAITGGATAAGAATTAASAAAAACTNVGPTTAATAVAFGNDGSQSASIFTGGGSKDPEDLSSWRWKDGGGLPDKDNLQHSFAARYTEGTADILTFGSDRYDNSGDAVQGFWFFQNAVTLNANGTFNGVHKNGDLLILSDFSNGGSVATINVYKWLNGGLTFLAGGNDLKCPSTNAFAMCGIVNPPGATPTSVTASAPWSFTDKSGTPSNGYLNGEFFEGGINLNDPSINLGGQCFASFASETRSSTSTTATLKDFVLSGFGQCGSTTVTTPKQVLAGVDTAIPADGISIGTAGSVTVRDSAVVTATGAPGVTTTGTVAFSICGPIAPTTPLGTCSTGGTAIGTRTMSATSTPPAANSTTVVSDAATVTSAGRYCFRAVYSGDASKAISGSSDSSLTECFVVNPVTPTLTTSAGPDVLLGNPVTDTASLTGTANKPGTPVIQTATTTPNTAGGVATGSITFSLYGPSTLTDPCGPLFGTVTPVTSVSGDGSGATAYGPVSLTPNQVGDYHWVAVYSGDSPNTLGVTHNADCSVGAETVTVTSVPSSLTSTQSFIPNDSVTVSAAQGGNLAGSVTFTPYASADCTGTPIFAAVTVAVSGASPQSVGTSNTTVSTTSANVSWKVSYASTNTAQRSIADSCHESTTLTITNGGTISSS